MGRLGSRSLAAGAVLAGGSSARAAAAAAPGKGRHEGAGVALLEVDPDREVVHLLVFG